MDILSIISTFWGLLLATGGVLASFVAWLWRISGKSDRALQAAEDTKRELKDFEVKVESRLEKQRLESKEARMQTDRAITELRSEIQQGFSAVNVTLEKVIFKLGDKADK